MLNFKQYLREENLSKIEIQDKINEWRDRQKSFFANHKQQSAFGKYKIVDGPEGLGLEFLSDTLKLYEWMFEDGHLPFKIYSAPSVIIRHSNSMKSFKNFPSKITGITSKTHNVGLTYGNAITENKNVTSLEGITSEINGINSVLNLTYFPNLNYSKVNNYIKSVSIFIINIHYKGPILSFLKIKNLERINYTNQNSPQQYKWFNILNKHLQSGRDILACQDELIENGFKEYAKL